jgi:cytochrome c556
MGFHNMNKLITTTVFIAIAGGALAHGKATGIVRERMDSMTTLASTMKSLVLMAKSDAPLDKAAITLASNTLSDHSGQNLTAMFPTGSTKHSEATALVWSQSDDFAKLAAELNHLAKSLPDTNGKPALMVTIKAIGASCSACHAVYRQKTD